VADQQTDKQSLVRRELSPAMSRGHARFNGVRMNGACFFTYELALYQRSVHMASTASGVAILYNLPRLGMHWKMLHLNHSMARRTVSRGPCGGGPVLKRT
jgi:hypothetical protein